MLRTMWPKPCTKDGRHCHDKAINSYWRVSILCKMLSKIPISIYARVCVCVCAKHFVCWLCVHTKTNEIKKSSSHERWPEAPSFDRGDLSEPARVNVPNEYSIGAESRQAETQKSSINCLRKDIIVVIQFNRAPEIRNSIRCEKSGKEK